MRKRLGSVYLTGFILEAPLFCLYGLLGVVLCKEMGFGSFGLMVLCSLKPLVALISPYWRSAGRGQIVQTSLVSAGFALFLPWTSGSLPYLVGIALFFLCQRAALPAWMELLRCHIAEEKRGRLVAKGALIGYLTAACVPLLIGPWLDASPKSFPWLFAGAGLLSLLRLPLQMLWLPKGQSEKKPQMGPWLLHPWRTSAQLLRSRPDFAWYQLLFFLGGLGLMVMQPALPRYVTGVLGLSYTEVGFAFAFAKGLGFIVATPLASRWFSRLSIFNFSGWVTSLAALSLVLMLAALQFSFLIYLAFFCYGVMQAGSHLSWHLAGPYFSRQENSAPYTSVNIALVGLRGLIGPALGSALLSSVGLTAPFWVGATLCATGGILAFGSHYATLRSR